MNVENLMEKSVVVLGPTACGKTRLAVDLAQRCDGEIISVDSRQVYRGLDIGSGKDLQEYGNVPYHLIDVAEATVEFSLFDYLKESDKALADLTERKKLPVFAGGTGLYLDALLNGYRLSSAPANDALRNELADLPQDVLNEKLKSLRPVHNSTDTESRERTIRAIEIAMAEQEGLSEVVQVNLHPYVIGIQCSGDLLRERIKKRLQTRLDEGMVEEVRELRAAGLSWDKLHYFGLEYRYIAWFLQEELNENDMKQKLASAIYQFARQQLKWFRKLERKGVSIHWISPGTTSEKLLSEGFGSYLSS